MVTKKHPISHQIKGSYIFLNSMGPTITTSSPFGKPRVMAAAVRRSSASASTHELGATLQEIPIVARAHLRQMATAVPPVRD